MRKRLKLFCFCEGRGGLELKLGEEEEEEDGGETESQVSKTQHNTGEMKRSTEVEREDEISRDRIRAFWIFISFIM